MKFMKKGLALVVALLLCVLIVPTNNVKAEGKQLSIITGIESNENVVKTFDQTVDNDSSTIPGLTISFESGASGDFFVVNVNNGATVNLSGFFTDEHESFIQVLSEDCGLKIIGNGTLNLILKSNPNDSDVDCKSYINSYYGNLYIGNDNGGPTINITADLDDSDESPYEQLYGFFGRTFHLKNTTINSSVFGYLFNGIAELGPYPVEGRDNLTLDNSTIYINYQRLNSYDTSNEKSTYLIVMDDPEAKGNISLKNKSKIKVVCDYAEIEPIDPSFVGQNAIANINLDNSTIEADIKNNMVIAQPNIFEEGCGAINMSNGSTFSVHSDNPETLAMVTKTINAVNSTLDIETKKSPIWINGDSVNFEDCDINISIDSTDPLPIFVGMWGLDLSEELVITITDDGVTQTWTKDNMEDFPKGDIKIEAKDPEVNPTPSYNPTHIVLNTGVN